ncbi:hypothetical protein [Cyclobacterium qasimii]|uniref:Uncharacterized protein n=1 Tax=Cyclobacterium qasimii TaxID=1350429 RepID=A0A512CID8_9BACT|nr:hypothetical protein [Cyclobacterium qasimii]GEO23972.1 hypothetical protein CQA01_45060 [Cyclobacterium qasimii]
MKELLQKILDDPKATIALSAVLISFISLLLSIITSIQNRRNNRLGVRPLAYIYPPDYEDRIAVIIQNKGTGPMITRTIKFTNENGTSKCNLIDFMPELEEGYYWADYSKASKIVLRPSEEKILIELKGDHMDEGFIRHREEIRRALSTIEVEIKYVSIFNEWCPFKLKYKLTWFERKK